MARAKPVVAIDGPAGAGKSTVSQRVAEALGFTLVDTGSLYRAVAFLAAAEGVSLDDVAAVEGVATRAVASGRLSLAAVARPDGPGRVTEVRVGGLFPGDAIRTPAMSMGASQVSAYPGVRAALLDLQRQFGREGAVVLEGRDIGTVVFPDAEVKVFLTASPEVRARRRLEELQARGVEADLASVLHDVIARDARDAARSIAPLREAPDAVRVDSSQLDREGTIDAIVRLVEARAGR
ncbi:MAG: (d)CMP kinase [Myxococcales bacterium]|nr:(d)CMP kinase [Myxococcales bacterium]